MGPLAEGQLVGGQLAEPTGWGRLDGSCDEARPSFCVAPSCSLWLQLELLAHRP